MHASTARLYHAASTLRGKTGQTNVANLLGQSPQTLANWEKRGVSKDGALLAEQLLGIAPLWLLQGIGEMAVSPMRMTPSNEGKKPMDIAVDFTLFPLITQETLMDTRMVLPQHFRLAMPDDALADRIPRNTMLVFERALIAKRGATVLVQDGQGRRCVRLFAEGRDATWRALPTNNTYAELDSGLDGLQLLAVLRWISADTQ